AGTDALLHRGRARVVTLFTSGEHVLERHHPRVGEEQGGIVCGHQGGAANDAVALPFEEGEESLADFLAAERPWLGRHFRSPRFAGQITPRSTLVNEGDLPLAVLAHHLHRNGLVSAADEEGGAVLRLR